MVIGDASIFNSFIGFNALMSEKYAFSMLAVRKLLVHNMSVFYTLTDQTESCDMFCQSSFFCSRLGDVSISLLGLDVT